MYRVINCVKYCFVWYMNFDFKIYGVWNDNYLFCFLMKIYYVFICNCFKGKVVWFKVIL